MNPNPLRGALAALLTALLAAPAASAFHEYGHHDPFTDYILIYEVRGIIECAAGAVLVATDDVCIGDDSDTPSFDVPADADLAFVEVVWLSTSVLSKQLALTAPITFDSHEAQRPEGTSPLTATVESDHPGGEPADTVLTIALGAAHEPSLVFDQSFTVYVSIFVNVEKPDDYTAIS